MGKKKKMNYMGVDLYKNIYKILQLPGFKKLHEIITAIPVIGDMVSAILIKVSIEKVVIARV